MIFTLQATKKIKLIYVTALIMGVFGSASAQRYTSIFTEMQGPIDWQALANSSAPSIPEYLFTHSEADEKYKAVVVEWIYENPDEFDQAKLVEGRLNRYVAWAIKADGRAKNDGPYGNPPFVYYPVNEYRPVFIDTHNPDQDSLIFKNKTQNWFFQRDTEKYIQKYGDLPEILGYPKPITHPDEFSDDYGRPNIDWYYPEFSTDSRIFSQYQELYEDQFGKSNNEQE